MVFNATFNNISVISWQEQVTFQWGDDDVCFVMDQYAWSDRVFELRSGQTIKVQRNDDDVRFVLEQHA
jgi:hypothetical protein